LLAGWIGLDQAQVQPLVQQAIKASRTKVTAPTAVASANSDTERSADSVPEPIRVPPPDLRRIEHRVEREAIKVALQHPQLAAEWYASVEKSAYTYPTYAAMHEVLEAAYLVTDLTQTSNADWASMIMELAESDLANKFSAALVDPITIRADDSLERYVTSVLAKLLELDAARQIADLKSELQRAEGAEGVDSEAVLVKLMKLEAHRRSLSEHARGIG
jgi:DNA primase